jgi:hypothetical protein
MIVDDGVETSATFRAPALATRWRLERACTGLDP